MYLHVHSVLPAQAIVITDPLLARYVLRSKLLDKFRFLYSFLDPVRTLVVSEPRTMKSQPYPFPLFLLLIIFPGPRPSWRPVYTLTTAQTLKPEPYPSHLFASVLDPERDSLLSRWPGGGVLTQCWQECHDRGLCERAVPGGPQPADRQHRRALARGAEGRRARLLRHPHAVRSCAEDAAT